MLGAHNLKGKSKALSRLDLSDWGGIARSKMNTPHAVCGLPPLQRSPVLLAASRRYNGPPFRWRPPAFTMLPRFGVGLPLVQWSPALLAASRFYNGAPFGSLSSSMVSRLGGGLPPV